METQRVLAGVAANLEWTNLDQDGNAAPASGAVTVEVRRDDSMVVLPAGSPTTDAGGGLYKVALTPAQNNQLDRLMATWTDAGDGSVHRSWHEVVGAYWFSVAQARAADPSFTEAAYPAAVVETASREIEDAVQAAVAQALGKGVSFVPRYRRIALSGNGLDVIELPDYFVRSVRSVTIAGETAFSAAELADLAPASGQLASTLRTWTRGTRNVVVAYEHGMDAPAAIIRRAALLLLKAWLPAFKASGSDPGARGIRSLSAEGISMSFMDAEGDSTGIAEVDRLIKSWLASPDLASVPV